MSEREEPTDPKIKAAVLAMMKAAADLKLDSAEIGRSGFLVAAVMAKMSQLGLTRYKVASKRAWNYAETFRVEIERDAVKEKLSIVPGGSESSDDDEGPSAA